MMGYLVRAKIKIKSKSLKHEEKKNTKEEQKMMLLILLAALRTRVSKAQRFRSASVLAVKRTGII